MAITMDKDRTLREYREGSARDGRYYDSTGNSWYPESDKEARQLNRLLKKHFKSYSVDKDGSIKGHETEDGGPHKTSGKAWDAWNKWRNSTKYDTSKAESMGVGHDIGRPKSTTPQAAPASRPNSQIQAMAQRTASVTTKAKGSIVG